MASDPGRGRAGGGRHERPGLTEVQRIYHVERDTNGLKKNPASAEEFSEKGFRAGGLKSGSGGMKNKLSIKNEKWK